VQVSHNLPSAEQLAHPVTISEHNLQALV